MTHKTHLPALLILLALALVLTACGFPSSSVDEQVALAVAQTEVALTQAALNNVDDPQDPVQASATSATATLTPTLGATPSPTVTLTPEGTPTQEGPTVSVSVDTNCRSGPGKQYDIIGALLVGETAQVVGRTADGQYWIIKNPDRAGECWLWDYYASVTGPTDPLPIFTPPPTPTPQFTWEGTWEAVNAPTTGFGIILSLAVNVDGRQFSAVMNIPGADPMLLSGTISDDWLTVSGIWSDSTGSGPIKIFALGTDQFNGNSKNGETLEFCGTRSGAFPTPCLRE